MEKVATLCYKAWLLRQVVQTNRTNLFAQAFLFLFCLLCRICRIYCHSFFLFLGDDSKNSYCIYQTALEFNLSVQRAIQRRIIQRGRPMPPDSRMLPKLIVHWNCSKGWIDENSRALNNWDPPFRELNSYAFIWSRLKMLGVCNTHQTTKAVRIAPYLDKHECLEKLSESFSKYGSFSKNSPQYF